jgi:site-specific DNA-methyltransferase (adenine-specific)
MNIEQIKGLPVQTICEKDCAIFMWATDSHLKEAISLMEAWGFKYVTIAFIWEKVTNKGRLVANLGAWTMKNYEVCLFGTRGAMQKHKKVNNIYQKVVAERTKHSRKPQEVRRKIKAIFGDIPAIELFARQKTEGWDVWGNEVDSDINLEVVNG